MPSLSKIMKRINQAKSAVNSIKGIKSKLESINWESVADADELKERAEVARKRLSDRKKSLEKSIDPNNAKKNKAKKTPSTGYQELQYPKNDILDNWIIFETVGRRNRATKGRGERGINLFNEDSDQLQIALHVPDELNSTAAVNYESQEMGVLAAGFADAFNADNFIQGLSKGADAIVAAASSAMQSFFNSATGNAMFLLQGKAKNPMAEQVLKGVDFRSFSFTYIMIPKSQEEADMINQIIYSFRTAMLPDTYAPLGGGSIDAESFFNYPNVFEVYFEGPIADKVDGFLPSVLTKCDVNHTGGLKFSTFRDGQPIKTQISLEFTELKILSQENYQQISPLGDKSIAGSTSLRDNQKERDAARQKEDAIDRAILEERKKNSNTESGDGTGG